MPQFVATGADAQTGQDRTIIFEADDETQAAAVAKARGVFVSKLERRPSPPTVEYAGTTQRNDVIPEVEISDRKRRFSEIEAGVRLIAIAISLYGVVMAFVNSRLVDNHLSPPNDIQKLNDTVAAVGWYCLCIFWVIVMGIAILYKPRK